MEKRSQGWTLGEVAEMLKGELNGPASFRIERPAPADSSDPHGIAFCESEKYLAKAEASGVGALLIARDMDAAKPHVKVDSPRMAFGMLLALASRRLPLAHGIDPTAIVSEEAAVHESASIGPYVVVERGATIEAGARIYPFCYVGEDCIVGSNATLYPRVTLYQDVLVGARTIIHSGAVLGSDGFGFVWDGKRRIKVPQVGRVVVGEDVEIGAGTTIDRATAGDTVIGRGTKIDNLVQIGHNCRIGEDGVIAGQVGISGSCIVGDRAVMGGQAALSDHATIADDVTFAGRTATSQDITEPGIYFGVPARPAQEALRAFMLQPKLPEMLARLRKLEKRLAELEKEKA
ncbi:MAG TPA: UDP-3-O-(3-hydroxymyristoyl)glucosamine N-acyltransferase [Fimbriimonadaceae bacterium]|nr:UDP-3-O-(3-hydroxymyristoyl)glucosamine N-acyltransferase [Fimbriimonadaceae bacterium]